MINLVPLVTAQAVAFWVLAPIAVLGALGMVLGRKPVLPDWKAIRRHYAKTKSIKQTAANFDVPINTLKARIRREGWSR